MPGEPEKRTRLARCHLYATVSESPARYAPWFIDINDFSASLGNFPALLTPALAAELDTEAQRFLHEMGIDEPVTWSPPKELLAGLILPGVDPNDIDLTLLHRLVRRPLAFSDIAQQLDTTLDAVRYALTLQPAPEQQRGPTSRPAPALTDLARALSAAALTDLYQQQKLPLWLIAVRFGVERNLVARLARQYGITLRPAHTPRKHDEIDRDWLFTEYVVNRRTLPDLAAEKGMSTMNMSRWAKTHGIPLRGRGGPSHTANIKATKAAQDAPEILQPALMQIGGAQRLSRFAAASSYPTVTAAAAALGLCQPVLHGQITRLQAALGGRLLQRAERGHPMTLTDLGTRVLDAWTAWSGAQQ
jgi:DNA-binding transcriptional LysR family regulator